MVMSQGVNPWEHATTPPTDLSKPFPGEFKTAVKFSKKAVIEETFPMEPVELFKRFYMPKDTPGQWLCFEDFFHKVSKPDLSYKINDYSSRYKRTKNYCERSFQLENKQKVPVIGLVEVDMKLSQMIHFYGNDGFCYSQLNNVVPTGSVGSPLDVYIKHDFKRTSSGCSVKIYIETNAGWMARKMTMSQTKECTGEWLKMVKSVIANPPATPEPITEAQRQPVPIAQPELKVQRFDDLYGEAPTEEQSVRLDEHHDEAFNACANSVQSPQETSEKQLPVEEVESTLDLDSFDGKIKCSTWFFIKFTLEVLLVGFALGFCFALKCLDLRRQPETSEEDIENPKQVNYLPSMSTITVKESSYLVDAGNDMEDEEELKFHQAITQFNSGKRKLNNGLKKNALRRAQTVNFRPSVVASDTSISTKSKMRRCQTSSAPGSKYSRKSTVSL